MTVRYFNLKKGSEKVYGGIIKVNTSIKGLERLSNPQGDWVLTPWTFEHVGVENGEDVYDIRMPNERAVNSPGRDVLGGEMGVAQAVSNGPPSVLRLKLNKEGEIRFYNPEQKGFYLNEVSRKAAKEHREFGENWALQRAYIYE
ncbi:hypothetical protein ES703_68360 [subsurface metagenome]